MSSPALSLPTPPDLHPGFDPAALTGLLRPERPLWTPAQLRDVTGALVRDHADTLTALLRYTAPDRWWTRIGRTAGIEVWLLSWLPGQGTDPHDHGGAAGAFTVLHGEVVEEHRYPGGPVGVRTLRAGEGLGFGGDRAHIVRNPAAASAAAAAVFTAPAPAAAATVHAYSPPLLPVRKYQSLEEVL